MKSENSLSMKNNPKILIIGKGYVGTLLYDHLILNFDVTIHSSSTMNYHDPKVLHHYLLNNDINLVINCSGFTGKPNVDEGESKKVECWQYNVESPLDVAKVCNNLRIRLIHISSGCIFSGYDKEYSELDAPNFGLYDVSSTYSKSKHAFEIFSKRLDIKILRLRMPICTNLSNSRNYLNKITKYENLIDYKNSKTFLPDLEGFVRALIQTDDWVGQDIYNVVNSDPLSTKDLVDLLQVKLYPNMHPNWVSLESLSLAAPRSNCVLDNTKASKLYKFKTEAQVIQILNEIN